jgi:hypothetical protein
MGMLECLRAPSAALGVPRAGDVGLSPSWLGVSLSSSRRNCWLFIVLATEGQAGARGGASVEKFRQAPDAPDSRAACQNAGTASLHSRRRHAGTPASTPRRPQVQPSLRLFTVPHTQGAVQGGVCALLLVTPMVKPNLNHAALHRLVQCVQQTRRAQSSMVSAAIAVPTCPSTPAVSFTCLSCVIPAQPCI